MITVQAKAKINLTLDVLYKRPDGYHEVEMVMQSIDLADMLYLRPAEEQCISLEVDVSELCADQSNLAYRAAALLQDVFHIKEGVHIKLEKHIPMAAGLAGGSADAAGVLVGLNRMWNLRLSTAEMEALAARLGSDVPFCLRGGTMLATGRGEKLTPLPDLPFCHVILAKPRIGVSTAWVYGQYRNDVVGKRPDTSGVVACLQRQERSGVVRRLCNVLETVTVPAHPIIAQIKAWMLEFGALASLMSGSGPTVFGLAESEAVACAIATELKKRTDAEIIITKTAIGVGDEDGTKIITN
jgi:4-diphosphocytidyl-2-C-methyl-D-erythritol kinase